MSSAKRAPASIASLAIALLLSACQPVIVAKWCLAVAPAIAADNIAGACK